MTIMLCAKCECDVSVGFCTVEPLRKMDKSQIKAELAAIQNELRLSMDSLRLATFKFTLILDRHQMGQFGLGGTPPARGIAQALVQQPAAFRPATPPSGGYSQGQQPVSPLSPLRPVSPLHPFTPPSGGFSPAQGSLSPVRPVTPPPVQVPP